MEMTLKLSLPPMSPRQQHYLSTNNSLGYLPYDIDMPQYRLT